MEIQKNSRRNDLVGSIRAIAEEKLSGSEQRLFHEFVGNAIHFYPDDEMLARPREEIFWSFVGVFRFSLRREASAVLVRVFNPEPETDHWSSQRTVIYINQRDMPFLVDSTRMALNRRALNIFSLHSSPVWVMRDPQGKMLGTYETHREGSQREAFITIEIDMHGDSQVAELRRELLEVLSEVELVVDDYQPMRTRLKKLLQELTINAPDNEELGESLEFLQWLHDGYFTFLGCIESDLEITKDGAMYSRETRGTRLGLLRKHGREVVVREPARLASPVVSWFRDDDHIAFSKGSRRSRIHRDVYCDFIIVKRYNEKREPIGDIRFLGLYTSQVYSFSPTRIPLIRKRVKSVLEYSGLEPQSHDGKALQAILEFHPRDEMFHAPLQVLADTVIGIWQIYERRIIRVFMHADPFETFVSCIVYLPRESFNTGVREKFQAGIGEMLGATENEYSTQYLPESVLVRVYLVYQIKGTQYRDVTNRDLERLVTHVTHDWSDDFAEKAEETWGERDGPIQARRFQRAFPSGYRERFTPQQGIEDAQLILGLEDAKELAIDFRESGDNRENQFQLKLIHMDTPLELSDMIPMLENLGFRVMVERPYQIKPTDSREIWLQDFQLAFSLNVNVDVSTVRQNFIEALESVWRKETENDSFNRLVLGARLDWRAVAMLRLYARYLKQLGISYGQDFISDTLARHLETTRNLVALFKSFFDPRMAVHQQDADRSVRLQAKITEQLEAVDNVNEDNVLRLYMESINATLRTNFFQTFEDGRAKPYISVKLQPEKISLAPKPRPAFEIFVYSPRVEGVHLRGGKVARGGLRWSDRIEDYRTEVLGLVKAQQVKNAVIVPTGAKGGFVAKQASIAAGREAWLKEGIASYMLYIQALLDITDNLINGDVLPPQDVICRDGPDPYLVVAADKGTATFSDIANEISEANGFWLGDAFASGGSNGYDHKGMGITAKGAWVAVQRHFREMGIDIQKQDFTVVGIGDMAGDVFGNGMLLSEHIQLVAAFNHMHIFIDPNPDAAKTFPERQRLFRTPRTTWDDFDKSLISPGGGVFSRGAKSISITPEIKKRFGIESDQLTPSQLISAILKSPVDLIWNGGIGTYVKASSENNAEVGDRNNDSLRVNGRELRCKVFGEGGNLGMTQRGRVEFCLRGGICNTDFIDNAAGVDCSDHEVNIKILLNKLVAAGELTEAQRNEFLAQMTDSVSALVLNNNYSQTETISLSQHRASRQYAEYQRFMFWLEGQGRLDRELEFLPNDEQLAERLRRGFPIWTRPELSVLISYSKVMLKELLADPVLLDDTVIAEKVNTAFPPLLSERYPGAIRNHQLRTEILATQLANDMVNRMGFTFYFRQVESTGANASEIVRAYSIVMDLLDIERIWEWIESRDFALPAAVQLDMQQILIRLVRRLTRWFLRNHRKNLQCDSVLKSMRDPVQQAMDQLTTIYQQDWLRLWRTDPAHFNQYSAEDSLNGMLAASDHMFITIGVVDTALRLGKPLDQAIQLHARIGEMLSLDWFMTQIVALDPQNRWQDLAREAFVDDLEYQRRQITSSLLRVTDTCDIEEFLTVWQEEQKHLIDRWKLMVKELKHAADGGFAIVSVALRELLDLVQATKDQAAAVSSREKAGFQALEPVAVMQKAIKG